VRQANAATIIRSFQTDVKQGQKKSVTFLGLPLIDRAAKESARENLLHSGRNKKSQSSQKGGEEMPERTRRKAVTK